MSELISREQDAREAMFRHHLPASSVGFIQGILLPCVNSLYPAVKSGLPLRSGLRRRS